MKKAKDQPESEPAELASLVGERIRKIRKEEGLSLELFALRCDMNAAYVGHRTGLGGERASSEKFSTVSPLHAAAMPPILVDGGRLT